MNNTYCWYAIYTRLNHEKAVELALREKSIEVFLPTRKTLRVWSDRKKWIEEPLFRSYMFVRVSNKEYHKVIQTPSVIKYICFGGRVAPVREKEIELVKTLVSETIDFELTDVPYLTSQSVRVTHGPFSGHTGKVIRVNGKTRLVVRLDHVQCSVSLDVDQDCLAPVN